MPFTLGINTNLRASDLLAITAGMVRDKEELVLKERKTGKERRINLNEQCPQGDTGAAPDSEGIW